MTTNRILAAVALGLALAACGGQQQADGTAAEATPAAGEMPQADETGTVTGSPEEGVVATDTAPVTTSADAGAMGEGGLEPVDPTTGTGDQPQDPLQTDPALEDTTSDPQQSATPPPPTQ